MIKTRIRNKRDSLSNWSKNNPVLLNGEIVIVEDGSNVFLKRGDGTSHFNSLPYISASIDLSNSVTKAELQAAIAAAETSLATHTNNKSNPHNVTKAQLDLDKVDNTADADKEVKYAVSAGTATKASQDALGNVINTTYATSQYVEAMYADSSTTLSTHTSNKSNPHGVTKEQLELGKVDNTADAEKEVKKAATADLATKAIQDSEGNVINTTYATIAYADAISASAATDLSTHTSNKSNPHNVTKAQLGLDKVDNTSDAEKKVLFAETAGNVGSSEKDGDGNVITATYATKAELEATAAAAATSLSTHANNKSNPHNVTKAQLGLDKVDNTSDDEKRVLYAETAGNVDTSEKDGDGNIITETYATKTELESTLAASKTYTDTHINNKSNPHGVTKAQLELDKVDNTADIEKTVKKAGTADTATKATQDASGNVITTTYATKSETESTLAAAKTYTDTHINNKSNPHGVTKAQLELDKVDNTADVEKTVKKAGTADTATKATQDASGNVITTTYSTKAEATAIGAAAQTYTDTQVSTLRSEITNISTMEFLSTDSAWASSDGVYKLTKAVGTAQCINVYKKISSTSYEVVCVDAIEHTTSGNLIITSPDKFNGFALMSKATAFNPASIENIKTMIRELFIENNSSISNIEIKTTDWTSKTVSGSTVYTFTRSVGKAKVVGVYETVSTGIEQAYPDRIIISSGGTLTIESPSNFAGYILLSSPEPFDKTTLDNMETLILNKTVETVGSNVVKTVNGIAPTNGAVTIPAVHEVNGIKFAASKWVQNSSTGLFTLTLSAGGKSILGCYRTVSGVSELVIPDTMKVLSSGNVEIISPVKFDGYVIISTVNWL